MESKTLNTTDKLCSYRHKNGSLCNVKSKEGFNFCQTHKLIQFNRNKQCRICKEHWLIANSKTLVCKNCRKAQPYEYIKDLRNFNKTVTERHDVQEASESEYEYIITCGDEEEEERTMEEKLLYHLVGFC